MLLPPRGGETRRSPPLPESRAPPAGGLALPHAETAIAAAQRPALTVQRMTRLHPAASRRNSAAARSEKAFMEKRTQDAGHGVPGTGDGEFRLRVGDNIAEGILELGGAIIRLMRKLPDDRAGRHVGIQLFRCATPRSQRLGQGGSSTARRGGGAPRRRPRRFGPHRTGARRTFARSITSPVASSPSPVPRVLCFFWRVACAHFADDNIRE
jgi:hypothetical protein